jgi:tRNA A-37 threonylcarbamoyl transferase component Bud32
MVYRRSEILGPYRILEPLGEGGMAKVYLGEVLTPRAGLKVGERVAIKVLRQHLVKEPGYFERFRVEAEVGIRLRHPNVVRTLDVGVTGEAGKAYHYLVMEPVKGRTVRDLLGEQGILPEDECRRIARDVTGALAAIHALDIVHRDIKPENILIDEQGCVKVMDLGVAFLKGRTIRLSATGQFVGSVYYAAPEQILKGGKELDARVDLYQLGLFLYEALTGTHPYRHQDLGETLRRLVHYSPMRVSDLNPKVSPFLEEVIHKLIAKDPEERFSSAQRLLGVLTKGEASSWWVRRRDRAGPASRPAPRRQPRETPLHGRAREMGELRELFGQVLQGRGRSVLIEGEAGIGKSRLVEEFCDEITRGACDASTLLGTYSPGRDAAAEGAFSAAFRDFLGEDRLEDRLAELLHRAQLLIPAFAALLRGATPPRDSERLTEPQIPRLFGDLLAGIAGARPAVLVIEDLHHAHEGGLELFESLARRVRNLPVLLIGTLRHGPVSSWAEILASDATVQRRRLSRLSRAELRDLLFDALGSWRLADVTSSRS